MVAGCCWFGYLKREEERRGEGRERRVSCVVLLSMTQAWEHMISKVMQLGPLRFPIQSVTLIGLAIPKAAQ